MTASAKLNTAFLDVAVAGDMAIPWSLPRIVGAARARDLSFIPRRIEADEAERIGLVARVFADDTFRDETEAVVAALLEKSPTALLGLEAQLPRRRAHAARRLRRLRGRTTPRDRRQRRHRRGVPGVRREAQAGVPMIRLRQVALVAHDLDPVLADLHRVLGLEVAFNDPGVADVRAAQRGAARRHAVHRGRVADHRRAPPPAGSSQRLGGDGGYMVISHTDDQAPFRERADGARHPDRVRGRRPRLPDLAAPSRRHRRVVPRDRLPAGRRGSERAVDAGRARLAARRPHRRRRRHHRRRTGGARPGR